MAEDKEENKKTDVQKFMDDMSSKLREASQQRLATDKNDIQKKLSPPIGKTSDEERIMLVSARRKVHELEDLFYTNLSRMNMELCDAVALRNKAFRIIEENHGFIDRHIQVDLNNGDIREVLS